jgi:hypothetical protein
MEAAMISTIDNIEILVKLAKDGNLTKVMLADSLTADARHAFLDKCAAIEQRLTTECAATGEPCLESGCALEGEACLNAVLNADREYHRACAAEWLDFFSDPANRSEQWNI